MAPPPFDWNQFRQQVNLLGSVPNVGGAIPTFDPLARMGTAGMVGPTQGPAMPPPAGAAPRFTSSAQMRQLAQQAATAAPTAASTPVRGLLSRMRGGVPLRGAGGAALAGTLAGAALPMVWDDPNSSADDMASSALSYGGAGVGLGAAVGSVVPGVGTAIGAGIGGLAGVGLGLLQGRKQSQGEGDAAVRKAQTKQLDRMNRLLADVGAPRAFTDQVITQMQQGWTVAQSQGQLTTADAVKTIADQIAPLAVQELPNYLAMQEQEKAALAEQQTAQRQQEMQQRLSQANIAAVQGWMQPMMQEQLGKQQIYADQFRDAGLAAAGQINDPGLRTATEALARQGSLDQATQNAYMLQQQAMMPWYLQQQQDQISQQQQLQQLDYQTRLQGLQYRDLSLREQLLAQQQQGMGGGGMGGMGGQLDPMQQLMQQGGYL